MTQQDLTAIAALLIGAATFLFAWFIYDREVRNSIIMTDLREDFDQVKRSIYSCTPADAEALITKFEDKWSQYVDSFTLSNYTSELYQIIFRRHGNAALN